MAVHLSDISELPGDDVTAEQLRRLRNRYYWAGSYCAGKDVLELASGAGQGLGYLAKRAKSLIGSDISEEMLSRARAHYNGGIDLRKIDAHEIPLPDRSLDVVVLFEAIYYLKSPERFVAECRRTLRPRGVVLIATANNGLYDFNPSPSSYAYFDPPGLRTLFEPAGFEITCFGDVPIASTSLRQRILRPAKKLAITFGLMPQTMAGKKFLKKIVFGKLVKLPAEIDDDIDGWIEPVPISAEVPDRIHKVIYCAATLSVS